LSSIPVYKLWHARLRHASYHISCKHNGEFCDACTIAKSHKLPFKDSITVYHTPLQLLFMDILGPASVIASCGSRYYISFLYANSRYTWIYLLNHKSQALFVFKNFKMLAKTQTWCKI